MAFGITFGPQSLSSGGGSWFDQNPAPPGLQAPGGFSSIVPGSTTVSPGYQGGAVLAASSASGAAAPPYVNMSDPVQAFVWQGFQQKGVTPRDQGDFQYWVDNVNRTGGLTDANKGYWSSRFAQGNGGIGDYGNGSGGGTIGGMYGFPGGGGQYQGGPFSMPTAAEAAATPGYQFTRDEAIQAVLRRQAGLGSLLTGGTIKAVQNRAAGLADANYGDTFNRALQTNQTNFGNLYQLAGLGQNAATGAAG